MKRRLIAKSIIEILKIIGKQGLSFQKFIHETVYNLDHSMVNH